jgi:hypothetical protein
MYSQKNAVKYPGRPSSDPQGTPEKTGSMNTTPYDANNGSDEKGVNRYGGIQSGYLVDAMNANGGMTDATARGANISGIPVRAGGPSDSPKHRVKS